MAKSDKPAKVVVSDDESESTEIAVKTTSSEATPATAPELDITEMTEEPEPIRADASEDEPVDSETEKALEDIASHVDEPLDEENEKPVKRQRFLSRLWHGWSAWWHNPVKRRLTLATLVIVVLALFAIPTTRYFVLNNAGVRSSALVVVLDDSTQQPLKNVEVKLGSLTGSTDKDGKVTFHHVRLGKTKLVVEKRAFAVTEKWVTIGWGSNPLEPLGLEPVGSQHKFIITDYLSGKPIEKAEAVSGLSSAVSDTEGALTLTLDSKEEQTAEVIIETEGYRTETLTLDLTSQAEIKLELVPARAHTFVSKRSGRYDVYKIDADGKNEEKVLSGSGVEREDLVLVPHPSKDFAALVSTRENARNRDGFLLSTLTLIDITDKKPSKIAQSERVQIIDWVGDKLVYVQIASGASASDSKRHRLMSYDLASGQSKELASANYFNDIIAIGGSIFYAPSAAYASSQPAFYKLNPDGSGKQTLMNDEVWNIFRTDYDKLVLAVGQQWYDYQISTNKATKLSGEPANLATRIYVDGLDRKQSLWIDQRDGAGVLLAYNLATKEDKKLHEQSGLSNPVHWLSNTALIFRVSNSSETADYVMSLDGGEPKKLKNVTNTSGVDRWYYY